MNIVYVENQEVPFDSIKIGDCFIYNGSPYIKVNHNYPNIKLNAISLENGIAFFFEDDEPVTPAFAEVYITTLGDKE